MGLSLDRIAIEEVGANPERLAAAIISQLPDPTGAVPVYDIARALDIVEIREQRLTSFEGCLLTDQNKSYGSILVNASSTPRRRRYTVGHELGHFLNSRHRPTASDGFRCTQRDMVDPKGDERHLRQEREANAFAIELLAPQSLLKARLARPADLEHVVAISDERDISREAAARRYVSLHHECLAVVFSRDGKISYIDKGKEFPGTRVWTGNPVPHFPESRPDEDHVTSLDEVSAGVWLSNPSNRTLYAQTLFQRDSFAITMLLAENEDREDG
jgi:hypothetical protein